MTRKQNMIKQLPIRELWGALGGQVDVFICCGSYEARCRTVADALDPAGVGVAVVAQNSNLASYVSENVKYLQARFAARVVEAAMDSTRPLVTGDALGKALMDVRRASEQRYLVDITTFTHESLLMLVRLLSMYVKRGNSVLFVYTSAAEYSVGATDENKWLSKGVEDIRSVLGYPGEILPSYPTHLIVLVGYEHERAARLIEAFEPNFISLGYGEPGTATNPKHQKANEHFHRLVKSIAGVYGNVSDFVFSCCDPWNAEQAILQCADSRAEHNIIIAPMNTKISTIGAALAAMGRDSIQLCYAQALQYNYKKYSVPGDMCHLFEVDALSE